MKRINPEDAHYWIRLEPGTPDLCKKAVAFALVPSTDPAFPGWEDVVYYSEGILDPTHSIQKPEWVYVLVNKSMPGICKVGMTTTSVAQRAKEINQATGVITPWFSVYKYRCLNSKVLERAVHERLERDGYRVNPKREGFEIPSSHAIAVIKELGEALTVRSKSDK
jgi:hypothetical protein